ncbi:MAG: hypothetical protein PHV30_03965 [Candidatus Margulisbacteria bacterium]|nr:hypothetical protein [Candidatus Margulisiibacteriota bacterium]
MYIKKIVLICFLLFLTVVANAAISDENWEKLSKYYYLAKTASADPQAHFNLAMAYAYTGFVEEGFRELSVIPSLDKEFAKKVLSKYQKKVAQNKTNWENHFYYAFALYFNDMKDKAQEEFRKVIQYAGDNAVKGWAYGYIAYIYGEKKDWNKALDSITTAVKFEPDGAALYFAMSIAKKENGDAVGATGAILKASTLQARQMVGKRSLQRLKNEK